jgi:hypothetical protein
MEAERLRLRRAQVRADQKTSQLALEEHKIHERKRFREERMEERRRKDREQESRREEEAVRARLDAMEKPLAGAGATDTGDDGEPADEGLQREVRALFRGGGEDDALTSDPGDGVEIAARVVAAVAPAGLPIDDWDTMLAEVAAASGRKGAA